MKESVLILCTGNSCRSQMAEGILRYYGHDRFEAESAGTKPGSVHPVAIEVMKEIGIDISTHRSKNVKEFEGRCFNHVITVCDNAKESCPVFAGSRTHHWPFPDPPHSRAVTDEVVDKFREVRDRILKKFKFVAVTGQFKP